MDVFDNIKSKQIQWAKKRGVNLIGSEGKRGLAAYTNFVDENLFEPLNPINYQSFLHGDGHEIEKKGEKEPKMQAVHSSSAICVNIFQYWQNINQISVIAAACNFCDLEDNLPEKIVFEEKYSIVEKFNISPNIDVVFHNSCYAKYKRFAVECKFIEPYNHRKKDDQASKARLKKYIDLETIWEQIPHSYELFKAIYHSSSNIKYLNAAQLIKHILGLKRQFGKDGFRLLYLWYDVPGKEGVIHKEEIESFTKIVKNDDIKFHSMSYQELITSLDDKYRQEHEAYIKYITERYL
jgi:hypothetical protein